MVHIREEGWKELKVGCVFAIRQQPTRDKHTGEIVDLGACGGQHVCGPLGRAELSLATCCGPKHANGTGCKPGRRSCWATARRGFGIWPRTSSSPVAKSWIGIMPNSISRKPPPPYMAKAPPRRAAGCVTMKHRLLQGHAERLARTLRQLAQKHPAVRTRYAAKPVTFKTTIAACNISKCAKRAFPSAAAWSRVPANNFAPDLAGSGMRWSRAGLERLLPIRAAIMSHRFDELWQKVYHLPLN